VYFDESFVVSSKRGNLEFRGLEGKRGISVTQKGWNKLYIDIWSTREVSLSMHFMRCVLVSKELFKQHFLSLSVITVDCFTLLCFLRTFLFIYLQSLYSVYYIIMQNEAGENVDLYVPRKCSWTNRLIKAKEHASVQINVMNVDPVTGLATGDVQSYALAGFLRFKSESDMAFTDLVEKGDAQMNISSTSATATE